MIRERKYFVAAVVVMLLLALTSQIAAQASPKRVVIRAGKLLDVRSGRMRTDQDILI